LAVFTPASTANIFAGGDNIYFTLTAGEKTVSATFNKNGTLNFNSVGLTLAQGESASVKITANPVLSNLGEYDFTIAANGSDAQ
jgi:hypothetical protein